MTFLRDEYMNARMNKRTEVSESQTIVFHPHDIYVLYMVML